jgi:hypothetical protein
MSNPLLAFSRGFAVLVALFADGSVEVQATSTTRMTEGYRARFEALPSAD